MKNLLKFYILTFVLFSDYVLFAQPGGDNGSGGLDGNDPPPSPINDKLILLALTGVLFVVYSFIKKRRQA
jgi:hypothetical protein